MEKKFKMPSKQACLSPPKPPIGHNVFLSSDKFSLLDEGALGPEEEALNACEMVAWKWTLEFSETRTSSVLRYCLQLSELHRRSVGEEISKACNWRSFLTRPAWSGSEWRRCFFPRVSRERKVIVADTLLFSQFWTPDFLPAYEDGLSVPPSYEDSEAALGLEAVVA
jgi:hypothetical protein